MFWPWLALFTRSLREDARSEATYWNRSGLSGFILIVLGSVAVNSVWSGAPGRSFFVSLITLQTVAITFAGVSYFSSAIAEEKENETLGLLRMTGLSPLSILLGKSTSRLFGALLLLIAQIPFTIFTVTLGGVSLGQVLASYCTLGAYTFLLCNVSLLGSVIARRTVGAATISVAAMAGLFSAGLLLGALHAVLLKSGARSHLEGTATLLWEATPIARLNEVLETGFSGAPVGWQVRSNIVLGLGSFLLAWAAFGRACENPLPVANRGSVFFRLFRKPLPRPPSISMRALAWKDFHFLFGGRAGLVFRIVGYGSGLLFACWQATNGGIPGTIVIGPRHFPIIPLIYSIEVAAMAARLFHSEIRDRTLANLGTLPFPLRRVVEWKGAALMIVLLPGMVASTVTEYLHWRFVYHSTGVAVALVVSNRLDTLLLASLVVWLSLWMTRGAFPVGYVAHYASTLLVSSATLVLAQSVAFGGSFVAQYFILLPIVHGATSIVGTILLCRLGLRRLEALAGES